MKRIKEPLSDIYPFIIFEYFLVSLFGHLNISGGTSLFTNSTFAFIIRALSFAVFFGISFLLFIIKKCKIDRHAAVICFLLLVFGTIGICFSGFSGNLIGVDGVTSVEYNPSTSMKIQSEISLIRFSVSVFCCISIFPKIINKKELLLLFKLIILFCAFCIVYLLVFQYKFLFSDNYSSEARSIFENKNSFGILLFVSSLLCIPFIFDSKHKIVYYVLLVLFFIVSAISYCRSAFIALTILNIGLLIYLIRQNKNKKIRIFLVICIFTLFLALLILGVFLFSSSALDSISFFLRIKKYLINIWDTAFTISETNRITIWIWSFKYLVSWNYIFFGYGPNIANYALGQITSISATALGNHSVFHNAYVQIIINGGLTKLFITMYVTIYYCFIKNNTKNRSIYIISVLWIALIFYQFCETFELFSDRGLYLIASIFYSLYLPYHFDNKLKPNQKFIEIQI